MSDPVNVSIQDGAHVYAYVFNKKECRMCHTQWHVVPLPSNQLPVIDDDGAYFFEEPTDDPSTWTRHIVFDKNIQVSTERNAHTSITSVDDMQTKFQRQKQ